MTLLKHGDFVFNNILSGGYKIVEDEPDVIKEVKMGDGSIKRNYRAMPKTTIKVKFGRLDYATYTSYMSHFANNEDDYSYYSPKSNQLLTKRFFVELPESSMLYGNNSSKIYDELEVKLKQCGEA